MSRSIDWTDAPMVGDVIRARQPGATDREIVEVGSACVTCWSSSTRRPSWVKRSNLHRYVLVRSSTRTEPADADA